MAADENIVANYDYCDSSGRLLYQNVRFKGKTFRQRRPNGEGGWTYNLNGTPRSLYRLPELLESPTQDWIVFTEGEKDADVLCQMGFTATTSGSATSWKPELAGHFSHRLVCIFPDNDDSGLRFARQVAQSLHAVAGKVHIAAIPGLEKGQDISDFIEKHASLEDGDLRQRIIRIIDEAPAFVPGDADDKPPAKLRLKSMGSVEAESIKWFWPNKIPAGALTVICGDPGAGKSFLTMFMASTISTGQPWPDCPDTPVEQGCTILISDEDDPGKAIRPRLDANGADADKVLLLEGVQVGEGIRQFDVGLHLLSLKDTLQDTPDCRLIIIDPITQYLGNTNANSNAEVRSVIGPLAALAADHDVTIIGVNHLNKRQDLAFIYRGLGSTAFTAQARSVWGVVADKEDSEKELIIFCPIKSNYCVKPTGLRYRIIDNEVIFDASPWTGSLDKQQGGNTKRIDEAADWLKERLANGAVLSSTIFEESKDLGFGKSLLYRAKDALEVKASKAGFEDGRWYWELKA